MQNRNTRTAAIVISVVMIIAIAGGAIFPLFNRDLQNNTPAPTPTIIATFPPPLDPALISYATQYMHPSGLFSVAVPNPPVWNSIEPQSTTTRQSVAFRNDLSVIEVYVEKADTPIASMDELNARFTTPILQGSWSRYSPVRETGRRVEGDRVLIDFELGFRQQTYLARHVAWTDGDWIYVVRIVMPDNARDQLVGMLESEIGTFVPYTQFSASPFEWNATYDAQARHLIRFPSTWIVTDSSPGLPTSVSGPDGSALRLESRAGSVADEAAARAFVTAQRPGATVVSVAPTTRGDSSGFSVAYSLTNADGDAISGLMVLLNNADGMLRFADLRMPRAGVDLNALPALDPAVPATAAQVDNQTAAQIMSTFWVFPGLAVPVPTLTPIPTALPTSTLDPAVALTQTALAPTVVPTATAATAEAAATVATETATEAATEAVTQAATQALTPEATPQTTP
ncbi:MAG: hypothetical protein HXY40_12060 [Chloroflexi bacterium]|nr:hypothetical protein [Chloroflexota bacterium]